MSFASIISTIEKDINAGFALVAGVVGTFDPAAGPLLQEIGVAIATVEGVLNAVVPQPTATAAAFPAVATTPKPSMTAVQLSALVQGITANHVLKQWKASKTA